MSTELHDVEQGAFREHRYLHFGWVQGGRGNAPGIDIVVLRKPKPLPDFFCLPAVGVMDLYAGELFQFLNQVRHDLVDDAQEAVLFIQDLLPLFQLLKHGMVFMDLVMVSRAEPRGVRHYVPAAP